MAEKARRPGGRSAQVVSRAHQAVRALVDAGQVEVGFPAVAERTGINLTTLYRRWGTPRMLLLDALVRDLEKVSAPPAGGTLGESLMRYADELARAVSEPRGLAFLRALIAAATDPDAVDGQARALIQPRLDAYQRLLDDAGEKKITPEDIVHGLLAPIYLRALLSSPFQPHSPELTRLVHNLTLIAHEN